MVLLSSATTASSRCPWYPVSTSTKDPPSASQQAAPLLAIRLDLTELAPKTVGQLPLPWPPGIAPVRGLPVFPGYNCPHCSLCTVNKDAARHHRHKEHQDYSKASYEAVQLQTWFSNHSGPGACWWRVDAFGPPGQDCWWMTTIWVYASAPGYSHRY